MLKLLPLILNSLKIAKRLSENLPTFSTTLGSLWKILRNVQKVLGHFRKSQS